MKQINVDVLIVLLIFTVLSACSSVQATSAPTATVAPTATSVPPTETPVPPTDTPEPTATTIPPTEVPVRREKVDVGGYKLYLRCVGQGNPTVLLLSGLGADMSVWQKIVDSIDMGKNIQVCTYNHAGIGTSEQSPIKPRTTQDMSEELRTLLINANISGPYILVGSGPGASIARIHIDQYPSDIGGMLIIGPSVEAFSDQILTINLPPETDDEHRSIGLIRNSFSLLWKDPMKVLEFWDVPTSMAQLEAARSMGDLPLAVVASDIDNPQIIIDQWYLYYDFDADAPENLLEDIEASRAQNYYDLAALSTNSELIVASGCSTNLISCASEYIVAAIDDMVDKVRNE